MFTLQELEEDPAAMIELKQDVREECEKLGEVTNVVLFDAEKDGIMSVRFADEGDAASCIKVQPPILCCWC
jgi:HIV Tat-specific factor 1